jgi:methylglutamate dehydrogenase subunit D
VADDLQISECRDFGLATVMLRKGADAAAVGAVLGVAMPTGPACVTADGVTVIGTGPGVWLAFAANAEPGWGTDLAARLPGTSVSDQSGGYEILKLSGPGARRALQKGAFIDLDPSAFGPGSAATTVIAHIGVVIWQGADAASFHVALFRSYARSFREWLRAASA